MRPKTEKPEQELETGPSVNFFQTFKLCRNPVVKNPDLV
jgi:hypothetical protein